MPPERFVVQRPARGGSVVGLAALAVCLQAACLEKADRWQGGPPEVAEATCRIGDHRCGPALERCVADLGDPRWVVERDCAALGLSCSASLAACVSCIPGSQRCDGQTVQRCDERGEAFEAVDECDPGSAEACRGGSCANLCTLAARERSNVGCEYWAVDLDNAVAGANLNAAAQQFAVVVSNPQPDLEAEVVIERDDSAPGEPGAPVEVVRQVVQPFNLAVFPLGPREVDGSPPGSYNAGTHTALTRGAYRIRTNVPVVAYQFNPLENVNVFSNDASLLKPVEALSNPAGLSEPTYVVLGWPQTISRTDDPYTNFSLIAPLDFRAFLTVVATRDDTTVRVETRARVVGGGKVEAMQVGDSREFSLDAFDVLNLETDDFNGDFTGSLVYSSRPVSVFSGGEASDAPSFEVLSDRRCCADHLEEQLDPVRSAGTRFIAARSFNRHVALRNAGADLEIESEPEVFRVIAVLSGGARVRTSLRGEHAAFELPRRGSMRELTTTSDFSLESDGPVMLGNVTASQSAAGVPRELPGGDPSFVIVPPIEQYRSQYVFLTPDRYAFDSLRIMAPRGADIVLDSEPLRDVFGCQVELDTPVHEPLGAEAFGFEVHRCQLSFPIIDPALDAESPLAEGVQADGVHRLLSDQPVGVIVDGFDRNVSYGYAAGTELREIVPR